MSWAMAVVVAYLIIVGRPFYLAIVNLVPALILLCVPGILMIAYWAQLSSDREFGEFSDRETSGGN